jgi:hypothetical protein
MIGLLFFLGVGLWIAAAVMLSARIPRWLGVTNHRGNLSVLLFPVVLVAPISDELIGRWQFNRLCEREAVVTLSPDWRNVKRAGERDYLIVPLDGYFIQIRSQRAEYFDIDTGQYFLIVQAFHTNGGFLAYRMGLGLGGSTSCRPKDSTKIFNQVNIDTLIEQGKAK